MKQILILLLSVVVFNSHAATNCNEEHPLDREGFVKRLVEINQERRSLDNLIAEEDLRLVELAKEEREILNTMQKIAIERLKCLGS